MQLHPFANSFIIKIEVVVVVVDIYNFRFITLMKNMTNITFPPSLSLSLFLSLSSIYLSIYLYNISPNYNFCLYNIFFRQFFSCCCC